MAGKTPTPLTLRPKKLSSLEELANAFGGKVGSEGGPRTYQERNRLAAKNIAAMQKAVDYVQKQETIKRMRSYAPSQTAKAIVSKEQAATILRNYSKAKKERDTLAQKPGARAAVERVRLENTIKVAYPWASKLR